LCLSPFCHLAHPLATAAPLRPCPPSSIGPEFCKRIAVKQLAQQYDFCSIEPSSQSNVRTRGTAEGRQEVMATCRLLLSKLAILTGYQKAGRSRGQSEGTYDLHRSAIHPVKGAPVSFRQSHPVSFVVQKQPRARIALPGRRDRFDGGRSHLLQEDATRRV
jgi:hypothetical protein